MDTPFQKRLDKFVFTLIALLLGASLYIGSQVDRSAWPLIIWAGITLLMAIMVIGGIIRRRGGNPTPPA